MSAPHSKNLDKKALFIWDDTAKDFVAWDNSVKLFDQNGDGLETDPDPSSGKNRLLTTTKITGADVSEGNTLAVATEDGAMLSPQGAVLLAGVDALTGNIRQRFLQTEAISSKNHLLVKDAYTNTINTSINRPLGIPDAVATNYMFRVGGVVGGLNGGSTGDDGTLNLTKDGSLRVLPSTGGNDNFLGKEATDSIAGANLLGVAAFKDTSNKAICPIVDSSGRVTVSATNISGTGASALLKAEDAAHATGDAGVAIWARRIDTLANSAGSSGDYATFNQDQDGAMYVNTGSSGFTRSDTFTGTGNGTAINCTHNPKSSFSIQVTATNEQVGVTVWNVVLEGSLNGTSYTTLLTHSATSGSMVTSMANLYPCNYYRARCVSLTLGTATNIVVNILGLN